MGDQDPKTEITAPSSDAPSPSASDAAATADPGAGTDASPAAAIDGAPGDAPTPLDLPTFDPVLQETESKAIGLLSDVSLNVKIELGRTRMLVEDVLKLGNGTVVELDKLAGDPVDVFVNDRHVARGEVLVLNDNFCVRINEILKPTGDPAKGEAAKPEVAKAA